MADKTKRPSLEEQVTRWLLESGLTKKHLPGEIVAKDPAYQMYCYDIDGKRRHEADIKRLLTPVNGFAAVTEREPEEKTPKYLNPEQEPPHVFFPSVASQHRIDWREHVRDPKARKLITEGWKKAACATLYGFPCAAIYGCWGFRSRKHGMMLLPEFNDYVLKDCDVYWIPDRDRKPEAIKNVLQASGVFAAQFLERDARFRVVQLPLLEGLEKVGLDDFLVHYSRQGKDVAAAQLALEELLAKTAVWEDWELTDIGHARRWVAMYGSRFRHIARSGWLTYRDGCWRNDSHQQQQETVKQMFEAMSRDAFEGGNSLRAAAIRRQATARSVSSAGKLAESDPQITATPGNFDVNPLIVNCKNATLELPADAAGQLRIKPPDAADFLSKQTAVAYRPDAKCPTFLTALDFWTNENRELRRTVQQLLGLSCTGITREQVFIVLYGPGQSGKSTLIETARLILADYSKALSSETLLVRKYGAEEERKVALLPGVRFATASETEQAGKLDENLVKLLTGEDSVTGRLLYHEQFDFRPQAKIWLRTNYRPTITGLGNAMWRRVVALPFGRTVPEERKDAKLKDKLRAELEGIFAWMIEGYLDYAINGLYLAPVVTEAVEEYRDEQDTVKQFLDFRAEFDAHWPPPRIDKKYPYRVGLDELHGAFALYCLAQHRRAMNKADFKAHLEERWGKKLVRKQVTEEKGKQRWFWCGLKLR